MSSSGIAGNPCEVKVPPRVIAALRCRRFVSFRYLGQYPSYFMFNGPLFLLATGYEKLIGKVRALNFLQGWIFVTLRKL